MIAEQRAEVTVAKARWLPEQLEPLAKLPVAEIHPVEVLGALRRLEARGQVRDRPPVPFLRQQRVPLCGCHVPRGARSFGRSPRRAYNTKGDPPLGSDRSQSSGELLRSIDEYPGSMITRIAMQMTQHVMCRPSELRLGEWREFDFDAAISTIPDGLIKMRRPHAVPLSKQVFGYRDELHALTGPGGFVFPAFHTFKRPMSENTINQVFRRMGYTSDEMTAHGWRTTASTPLNETGKLNPDAIECSLAHTDSNAVCGTYNRGRYWAGRGGVTISTGCAVVPMCCAHRSDAEHHARKNKSIQIPLSGATFVYKALILKRII
jgi:hypothetical protein